MGVVYKTHLFLTPYGAKQYIERTGSTMDTTTNVYDVYFVPSDNVKPTITFGDYSHNEVYSGETFKNTISVSDNYGVQSVSIPNDSGIRVSISNNNTQVSGTAPNVTSVTNKSVKVTAIDKSNNQIIEQFNVLLKPLKDKYRLTTSSTNQHPVRLNNIQNGATLSPAETICNRFCICD